MPPKPIFKTDIPYTQTTWPQVSPQDQTIILDLLCNLLEPVGQHRQSQTALSLTSKKRKRKRKPSKSAAEQPIPAPAPALSGHILIGLNSTTRHLTTLASLSAPHKPASPPSAPPNTSTSPPCPISLLILPHPNPASSLPHAHIPTLVNLSSLAHPSAPKPRLILLPSSSESRIADALHLPRVGAIGILEGCPGAEHLVEYARERIGEVEVPWIEEARRGVWKGVNIVGP